jgi:hypothetical protein
LEFRLKKTLADSPWNAQVYIRRVNSVEVPFGPHLTDGSTLDDRLRRAQRAILNPNEESERYIDPNTPSSNGPNALSFSSDVVVVKISGPDVEDLTFIDLPGVVGTGENQSDMEDSLIRGIANGYIARANTLILLTLPMRDTLTAVDDLHYQAANVMARLADPERIRTIGICFINLP